MVGGILPDTGEEIIKSPDTGSIPKSETAEDGIKGRFPKRAAPDGDGSHFKFQSKEIRTQHTGGKAWSRTKDRIAIPHNGIGKGKIQIPELHDIILGAIWKHERIGIKLNEIRYESILIGGIAARITR